MLLQFIDCAKQITHIDHNFLVANVIQNDLDDFDSMSEVSTSESTEKEFKRIHLGAQQKPVTLSDLQSTYKDDPAFTKF